MNTGLLEKRSIPDDREDAGVKLVHKLSHILMRGLLGSVTGVRTSRKVVALTFDDGPDPDNTPRLLDLLSKHGAKGTFFMVGEMAARHPEIVQQVAAGHHAIGNHTWDHPSFPCIGRKERWRQLRACAGAITPYGVPLFRPPYGHQSVPSRIDSFLLGYRVVTWTAHVEDWCEQKVGKMAARLLERIRPGSIVLRHDAVYGCHDNSCTRRDILFAALDEVLARLNGSYYFVTVPDLSLQMRPASSGTVGGGETLSGWREPAPGGLGNMS